MSRQAIIEAAIAAMEPEAQAMAQEIGWKEAMEASQAISRKRMADALERMNQPMELCATVEEIQGEEIRFASMAERIANAFADRMLAVLKEPLNAYGEGIGECIQGQIGRGNAGIR